MPWPLRGVTWILLATQAVLPVLPQALAASQVPEQTTSVESVPLRLSTPPPAPIVTVNRTVPQVTPPTPDLKFSANPTDAEIYRAHVFEKPIVAVGSGGSTANNRDLAAALLAYQNRQDYDDASAIEGFLETHPNSPYYISLLANLATHYRSTSQFSKALAIWPQVWDLGKNITDVNGRQIVDQAVGDWATFLVTLGRMGDLKALLHEINGRQLHGAAAVRISDARSALSQMEHAPQKTFKCGPYSVWRIEVALHHSDPMSADIVAEDSTTNGTSLYQNWLLANRVGLKYQMAKRQLGADIPLPAMVHWKLGHFSALTRFQDGHYRIEDPTFNQGFISPKVLDEESDGYFLIPDGPLPAGWSTVGQSEAEAVFGRSAPQGPDPNSPTPPKPPCNGMAKFAVGLMRISLSLFDTPLSYTPPRGPKVEFAVTYAEQSVNQTGPFSYSNLGNQWGFGWLKFIQDNTTTPTANVTLILNNGNAETFTGFNTNNNTYAVEEKSQGQLTKTSANSYQCVYPDGSTEIYSITNSVSGPRNVFLSKEIDPQGNALTFIYDSNYRLTNVVDAIGQVTTLSYGLSGDIYKITKVTDPFGRYATFQYNSSGLLTNITDEIGISSSFAYGNSSGEADFINALTTPYGATTFADNANQFSGRWIVVTDPLGAQERYEFTQGAPGVSAGDPASLVPTGLNSINLLTGNVMQNNRMSFFWNKQTMAAMNGSIDYTKAKQFLWERTEANYEIMSATLEAVKEPLESARLWYGYPGQAASDDEGTINQPSLVARVLDDGTTQATLYQRNTNGLPTKVTDPAGRITLYIYATNNIDLLSVAQLNAGATNILAQYTYNSQHLPLTSVDAAGQATDYGYNTNGQLVAMTNALNQVATLNYDTNGYLANLIAGAIIGGSWQALNTNSFTYDGYGRVRTVTDPLGYAVTTSYDNLDRPTNIFYPDGTYQQTVYNYLDPVLQRDRDGRWTAMAYDPLRHLTDTYNNAGQHAHFDWCGCGSLADIIDANGNVTTFVRDLQSRVMQKVYPDLTTINYAYETNSSRLKMVTDAKNQSTIYSYFVDNNLKQVAYSNAMVATPTASFTYDTNYNRVLTMTDGTGTTTYSYYGVTNGQFGSGQLSSVSNSFIGPTSVIAYNYDALGRITNRAINGVSQTVAFDMLNRVSMVTNVLGAFTNTYVGGTALLNTNFYPNGQKTVFSYLGVTNDERLAEIWNQNSTNGTISKFDYVYDPLGNITNWTEQADNNTPAVAVMQYDPVNQLLNSTTFSNTVAGAILKQYAYSYDLGGNRTSEQIGTIPQGGTSVAVSQSFYNNDNQVTNRVSNNGTLMFAGTISRQGTVTVNGVPATMNHFTTNFVGYGNVASGTNVVPVIATDYGNHSRTNNYQVVVTNNGVAETLTYDLDGNLTNAVSATNTNSYQWDAASRMVSASSPTNQSLFSYDGLGRRVQIIELTNGVAYVTNKFIWDGQALAEQRDMTGANVTKRFFARGEQISGTSYFFTRDHLGSVREVVNNSGVIQYRADYDPYGRTIVLQGSFVPDFGYAGMYVHQPSGLNLTLYRAYSADLGRWLSRDPLAEAAGLNLYAYVANNPINAIDLDGRFLIVVIVVGAAALTALGIGTAYYQWEGANQLGQAQKPTDTSNPDQLAQFNQDSANNIGNNVPVVAKSASDALGGPMSGAIPLGGPSAGPVGDGAIAAGTGALQSSGDVGNLYNQAKNGLENWWKRLHPRINHVWRCQDNTGLYIVTQPNSPGPQWTLIRTITQ